MSSRWIRWIATASLLTLGFGVPAQAKPSRQGSVLEGLTAHSVAWLLGLKDEPLCGSGYCPTPPPPPPPGQHMSNAVRKPRLVREGSPAAGHVVAP